jgi:hypothetical protein
VPFSKELRLAIGKGLSVVVKTVGVAMPVDKLVGLALVDLVDIEVVTDGRLDMILGLDNIDELELVDVASGVAVFRDVELDWTSSGPKGRQMLASGIETP